MRSMPKPARSCPLNVTTESTLTNSANRLPLALFYAMIGRKGGLLWKI